MPRAFTPFYLDRLTLREYLEKRKAHSCQHRRLRKTRKGHLFFFWRADLHLENVTNTRD